MIQDIDNINVTIQDDNNVNVTVENDSISVSEATPTDIAEIMHNEEIRQENETQRIANEEQRIENETAREDYINDLKQRVLDGEFNGQDGQDGQDGFSPIANVLKSGDTATITITDKNGTTTAQISDGVDGVDGEDGFSPSASVTKSGSVATITITDKSGTTTANIYDGSGGGGGIWGSITGTLSDQTDLQNALDGKQATIDSSHKLDADLVDDSTSANKFLTGGSQTIDGTKEFTTLPQYAFSTEPISSNELTTKAYVDNNFKYQRSTMPTAGSSYNNKVYQYTGTTTANYTNGYFYKCVRSGTSPNYTYSWERLDVQPSFSGNYNDLSNKPTIPDELADLSDDSTHRVVTDTEKTTWSGKQDALVSGTNIKTINNTSLLGSGDIEVGADIPQQDTAPSNPQENDLWIDTDEPGLTQIDSVVSTSSINPIENQAITNYVNDSVATKQNTIDSTHKLSADLVDDSNSTNKFFSGNYDDLTNKPTIPTVNNATLTIQKNGTTVKTFTANASSNVTANITTPTITSLWSGSKNTTGDITLSQSYANFDLIAITVAAPESTCEQVFFLWGGTITQNKELNFAIFQGTDTCMSVSCKFTSNTKLNIIKFTNSTWWSNLMWVKSVKGIKF